MSRAALRRAACRALIPEIDGIVGTAPTAASSSCSTTSRAGQRPVRLDFEAEPEHDFLPRLVTTPRATAYLKIAEGCDHPCTFCIIPQLRGAFRSRSENRSAQRGARTGRRGGTKELILIAQDTSMWGRDRGTRRGGLAELLERLHEIDGIEWIRLLYLYPATVDRELIDAIAALPKVCKYMDMPLQHAHPEVLRAMRRPGNGERYLEIIDDFRARIPGITMRSTFIVGFPGETRGTRRLSARVDRTRATRSRRILRVQRRGRHAGAELPARSPSARERRKRLIRLREAQRLASEQARSKRCGTTVRVLVEERRRLRKSDPMRERLGARERGSDVPKAKRRASTAASISPARLDAGEFADVTLDGHGPFDFYGTPRGAAAWVSTRRVRRPGAPDARLSHRSSA